MNAKAFKASLIKLSIKLIKTDIETDFKYKGNSEEKTYSGNVLTMKKGEDLKYVKFNPEDPCKYFDTEYEFCFNTTDCPFTSFNEKNFKRSKWYFLDPFAMIPDNKINQVYKKDIKDKDIESLFDKRKVDLIVRLFSE